jgi:NIMA (never in mitosis gene a)-related kinase
MSPEICGAERYSVASDIWSLGCLIYELCTQRPPFTAQAHAELYAKIKKGVYSPLPPQYSAELAKVVASCLQVNFHLRPTAAELLALPVICLVRKQHEAVQLHKQLRKSLEEVEMAKTEIDETLRKEWEVRAQGEINRVVREEKQRLNSIFEAEVGKRVAIWAAEHAKLPRRASDRSLGGQTVVDGPSSDESPPLPSSSASSDRSRISDESQSFIRRGLGRLSLESPDTTVTAPRPSRTPLTRAHTVMAGQTHIASPMDIHMADTTVTALRPSRTPLTRAHTVMAGQTHIASPMDIQMADPSPMSIVSLSLSPRKDSASTAAQAMSKNMFARGRALAGSSLAKAIFASDDDSDEGGDEATDGDDGNKRTCSDSPSCEPSKKMRRRASAASNMKRLMSAPALAPAGAATAAAAAPGPAVTAATARRPASAVPVVASSPTRARKAGATAVAGAEATSPTRPRKAMFHKPTESGSPARKGLRSKRVEGAVAGKVAAPRTANTAAVGGVYGRTLIELAQARAGGVDRSMGMGMASPVKPTMWDPERDEMPSPFLARGRARHM